MPVVIWSKHLGKCRYLNITTITSEGQSCLLVTVSCNGIHFPLLFWVSLAWFHFQKQEAISMPASLPIPGLFNRLELLHNVYVLMTLKAYDVWYSLHSVACSNFKVGSQWVLNTVKDIHRPLVLCLFTTNSPHLKHFSVQSYETEPHTDLTRDCCLSAVLPLSIFMDKDTHDLISLENLICPETKLNWNNSWSSLCLHDIPFLLTLFWDH